MRTTRAFVALACLVGSGCATPPEHDNFKAVMDRQIGKLVEDPDFYPVFYRLRPLGSKPGPKGTNTLYQYAAGRSGRCQLAFEVEPASRRVVRWSFEGEKSDCVIVPRVPD